MPLEATMMIIDNSEYMRNGDYQPTRFDAQADAVNTIFQTKTDSNPENTVGIMTMAGKGPEVLVTHTKDIGQIIGAIHQTRSKIGGTIDIPTAINIAQLALKHRENKSLRQRIIVFAASPLEGDTADEGAMIKLAKKLRKNNVAVDVVCFGDGIEEERIDGTSATVLKAFIENVNNTDNSHLVVVPPSTQLLSDALITSPILAGDRAASIPEQLLPGAAESGASGATANNFEFGVDPNLDPDLAMALRISMQEAQAREAAEAAAAAETPSSSSPAGQSQPQASAAASSTPVPQRTASLVSTGLSQSAIPAGPMDDEEERLLQQALVIPQQHEQDQDEDVDMEGHDHDEDGDEEDEEDEDEDEAIQRAIAMSLEGQNDPEGGDKRNK